MFKRLTAIIISIIIFSASFFAADYSIKSDYIYKNLSYGSHERQVLDLYLPTDCDGEVGLILYIHGGGWIAGDKDVYYKDLKRMANESGYVAAAINYRYLSEDVDMFDIADDIQAAVLKIKETAANQNIAVNKMLLTGGSAGAHLSMFYAYSRADSSPIRPAAVVSYCGPTDFTDKGYFHNCDLGDPASVSQLFSYACGKSFTYPDTDGVIDALKAVSPLFYVNETTVPTVINHGEVDTVVPYSNATAIIEKFEEFGVEYEFNSYPDSGHGLDNNETNQKIADELFCKYITLYLGEER